MISDATPLFDDDAIYISTVDFSENTVPEPLTRNSVAWLPTQLLRAAATVAIGGVLTIVQPSIFVSNPVVWTRAVKAAPWSRSPLVPPSVVAGAATKAKLFVHAPHEDADLEHPDID